jgi:hypothetical protein
LFYSFLVNMSLAACRSWVKWMKPFFTSLTTDRQAQADSKIKITFIIKYSSYLDL